MKRFPMAPMSGLILGLTLFLLLIPAGFLVHYFIYRQPAILAIGGFIAALYLIIALWLRPSAFVVTNASLDLVFPLRRRSIPLRDISGARIIPSAKELRREYGNLLRVGAGGFLGTFGLLWGRKQGSLDAYTSRIDRFVLVERRSARSLLISPTEPERFVEQLTGR